MNTIRTLTAALALALPLAAQAQTQRAVLSGTTSELAWSVYGPGQLGDLDENATNLRVSVHPAARILGVKYGDATIIMATRVSAPLNTVYTFHDVQLREQGFKRTSQNLGGDSGQAFYTRDNDTLELRVTRQPGDVYRTTLNLTGVRPGSAAGGQMNGDATPTPLLRDNTPGRLGYLLYGPVVITGELRNDPTTIRLSVPGGATIVGSSREDEDIRVTFRSDLSLAQVSEFYRDQFTRQGFTSQAAGDAEADKLSAVYTRGQNRIEWSAEREGAGTYQVLFNFEGARDGNTVNGTPAR